MVGGVGNDAKRAGPQCARFRKQIERLLLGVEHAAGDLQQLVTGLGQRHLFLVPVEEEHVIFLFQLAHLIRHGRLREEQRLCRTGEASTNRNIVERAKLDVTHGPSQS